MSEIAVTGLAELAAFLDQFPDKLQRNIMRGALRAGCNVIKADAKSYCPSNTGALRASIRVSSSSDKASVKAGNAKAYYSNMVEFGTQAHIIKAKNGGALAFGGGVFQSVSHPGAKGRPFMRPALDGQAGNAVVAAGEYIKSALESKGGIDASGVDVGLDE